jgi:hypothetical protein
MEGRLKRIAAAKGRTNLTQRRKENQKAEIAAKRRKKLKKAES